MVQHKSYKLFIPSYYDSPLVKGSKKGARFYSKSGTPGHDPNDDSVDHIFGLAELVDSSELVLTDWQPENLRPYYDYYGQFLIVTEKVMRFFVAQIKNDLETAQVELHSPSGKVIPLPTPYYALRTTKVVDCVDLENSITGNGDTYLDVFAAQQRYDNIVARGENPDFVRPPTPYFLTTQKFALKLDTIPPNSLFFTPKYFDCKFIANKFARDLLKIVVSEGGDREYTFWLIDLKKPFANFEAKCQKLG